MAIVTFLSSTFLVVIAGFLILARYSNFLNFVSGNEDISLLINIGNGGINIGIASFAKKKLPNFLYTINAPYIGEALNTSKLSDNMSRLLDSLLKTTLKEGWSSAFWKRNNRKFSHVIVSFSSPWLTTGIKNIHLSQKIPFIITNDFINDIVLKEKDLYKNELINIGSRKSNQKYKIIESSIVHSKINGYTVDNVIGRKTTDFDAFIYTSAISETIENNVSNKVMQHTHISREHIYMHSFSLVMFSTIRDNFGETPDFLAMNINSEITDIILVNNHIIKSVESFPFGKNTIIRQISRNLRISLELAESQLAMFMSGKLDENRYETIQKILEDLEREWAVYFENTLTTLSKDMSLPKKMYILTNTDISSIFLDFLKVPKRDITSNFRKNLEITHIEHSELSKFYINDTKEMVNESLIILAMFYNKLIHSQ